MAMVRGFTPEGTIVLVVATDKRLFILDRRAFYGAANKEISYMQVANVRYEMGLFFGRLIIDDQGEDHRFGWIYKRELRNFTNLVGDKVSEYREKSVKADSKYLSVADELDKLWALKEKGVISQSEFIAQKKALMKA